MLARFVCVFACVVIAQCLPARQLTPEELGERITVLNSQIADYDSKELLKELAKEDTRSTTEKPLNGENQEANDGIPDEADVAVEDQSEEVSAKEEKSEEVAAKDETKEVTDEDKKPENSRGKRDVKDRTDIETIVTVKNNEIGTEKEYYFRTIHREVKGEKYKCKIGLTSGDVMFYYRCLLVSNGIEGLQETGQGDFFDIA